MTFLESIWYLFKKFITDIGNLIIPAIGFGLLYWFGVEFLGEIIVRMIR
jgi:hypothetical protein